MSQEKQTIEVQAPTVAEAVDSGLAKLGLTREWVDVEVIDEGRRGLLGIGGREALVRLRVLTKPRQETAVTAEPEDFADEAAEVTFAEPEPVQAAPEPLKSSSAVYEDGEADVLEADTAKEVVEALLGYMGVEATVETALTSPDDLTKRQLTVVNITGDDLGLLIGARGETLDSLQHLARLMAGHQMRRRANFVIDVEEYRERREQALARLADRMAQKAIDRGSPVTLEPMPAYERRVIHMTLRENPEVRTESTGEGNRRRVRIYPV